MSGNDFDTEPQGFQIPATEVVGDPDSLTGTNGERAQNFRKERLQALNQGLL